jgi:hypothetical protein
MGTHFWWISVSKQTKRQATTITEVLYAGGNVVCAFEFPLGSDTVKTGDLVRIKNLRGMFRFYKIAHNATLDVTWIDCTDAKTGEFRSFYLHKVKSKVKPKRSYKKRVRV